jgi:class I fructose-bisphosphate aldolase
MFGSVREAWNMGAIAVGATVYFGSAESDRQIIEVARAFEEAHSLGMVTILWCYARNNAFVKDNVDYNSAADITGGKLFGRILTGRYYKTKITNK